MGLWVKEWGCGLLKNGVLEVVKDWGCGLLKTGVVGCLRMGLWVVKEWGCGLKNGVVEMFKTGVVGC